MGGFLLFLFWLAFSIVVGVGASGRGRSGFGWFILAFLFSPLLTVILLFLLPVLSDTPLVTDRVKCPRCAELILRDAKVCRFCGFDLSSQEPQKHVSVASELSSKANT